MNIYSSSNDLFVSNLKKLIYEPEFKCKPRNMFIHENLGTCDRILDPRRRLIVFPERKWDIFYALGEFLWYISGSNDLDMISHYAPSYTKFSDDGKTLYGAYGARMFSFDETDGNHFNDDPYCSIIRKLKSDADSRQAILLLWKNKDMHIKKTNDLPCTVYLQFFIRDNKLDLIVNMRSNDIWLGTTNDIFCFTMLQEMIASELDIELGFYQHNAGSLHVYENIINKFSDRSEIFETDVVTEMRPIPKLYQEMWDLIAYEKTLRQTLEDSRFPPPSVVLISNPLSKETMELAWILYCGNIRKRMNVMKKEEKTEDKLYKTYYQYFLEGIDNISQEQIKQNLLSRQEK